MCCDDKPHGRIWWHWFIEMCPKCKAQHSNGPIWDEYGEDVRLFKEVEKYNEDQRNEETNYLCHCGARLKLYFRHASQDEPGSAYVSNRKAIGELAHATTP